MCPLGVQFMTKSSNESASKFGAGTAGSMASRCFSTPDETAAPLPASKPTTKKSETKKDEQFADLVAGLKSLGLTAVNAADVRSAVAVVFPNGIAGIDGGQVIRAVFLHLKRRDTGDNVGR